MLGLTIPSSARAVGIVLGLVFVVPACHDDPSPVDEDPCAGCYGNSDRQLECSNACGSGVSYIDQLDECAGSLSDDERSKEVGIVDVFLKRLGAASPSSGIGEGASLVDQFSLDADNALITLAQEPGTDALHAPFVYDGGVYTAALDSLGDGKATVQLLFDKDYQAGKAGDVIRPYFFRTDSYVTGAAVDLSGGVASVSYESNGPLVELLGLGEQPPNPFEIGLFDQTDTMVQIVSASIDNSETTRGVDTELRVSYQRRVNQQDDERSPLSLDEATATRAETGQTLTVASSSLAVEGSQLVGKIELDVSGGAFDYHVVFGQDSGHPTAVVSCAK